MPQIVVFGRPIEAVGPIGFPSSGDGPHHLTVTTKEPVAIDRSRTGVTYGDATIECQAFTWYGYVESVCGNSVTLCFVEALTTGGRRVG